MSTKEALLKELKRITGQIDQGEMELIDAEIDVQMEARPREVDGRIQHRPTGRQEVTIRLTMDEVRD